MPTPEPKDPLDLLEELHTAIGRDQAALAKLAVSWMAAVQEADDRFIPHINPLVRSIQDNFDQIQRIAETHRSEILQRGKKSSKRPAGTIGWRALTELIELVDTPVIIDKIKQLGPTISRKLLRHRHVWELRIDAFKAEENAELVAGIDVVDVRKLDDFYIVPRNGFRMSASKPWWKTYEGMRPLELLNAIFEDPR